MRGAWARRPAPAPRKARRRTRFRRTRSMFDWLVVGAGFAGSILAERLASQRGERVVVIDRRPPIAGNAHDHPDQAGGVVRRAGARARQRAERVVVIARRPHIAGNAYDHPDQAGVLMHRYGPHIFHTNSKQVFDHLSRFTQWRPYEHRVLAEVESPLTGEAVRVPMPINLDTVNRLYGLSLSEDEVEGWMAERAERVPEIRTSEDVVVCNVGGVVYASL